MNIALFAHRLATPTPTGIDRYARELIAALASAGEHSLVALSTHERDDPEWLPSGVELRRVRGPRQAIHLAWCVARRPRVDSAARHADIVHVTAPTFPVPADAPLVYTVHDVMPLLHPQWFDRVHRWGFKEALKDVRDRAAAVIADSASTADALHRAIGVELDRIAVIPLGVPPDFLEPVEPHDIERAAKTFGVTAKSYVVFVGQVNDRKNVRVVIEALARLGPDRPTLVVAGPDDGGARDVHALVDRLGLATSVRFTGFVSDRDLPPLVAGARALVHPSLHEGFGLPPLEAMAVGVPAVVADTAMLPDAVGDAALVAAADDPDAWAAAIDRLTDDDVAAVRGAAGQAHARRFTWARTAAETAAVYQRAAGHGSRRG